MSQGLSLLQGGRRAAMGLALALAIACQAPALAAPSQPSVDERVNALAGDMGAAFARVAARYRLTPAQVWQLSDALGDDRWDLKARRMGVPPAQVEALYQELETLPHKRHDELTPYNLLMPAKDRWGLTAKEGIIGWQRYGALIERVAIEQQIDPLILGAYVWTESNFDTNQDTRRRGLIAIGLTSVQAQDHPRLGRDLEARVALLKRDPYLNLTLAAREFKSRWKQDDMFSTVMDVWYPAWRKGGRIPNLGTAYGYVQLFSNRYFLLMTIMGS